MNVKKPCQRQTGTGNRGRTEVSAREKGSNGKQGSKIEWRRICLLHYSAPSRGIEYASQRGFAAALRPRLGPFNFQTRRSAAVMPRAEIMNINRGAPDGWPLSEPDGTYILLMAVPSCWEESEEYPPRYGPIHRFMRNFRFSGDSDAPEFRPG